VAAQVGCTAVTTDSTDEIYVQAVAKCTIGSDSTVRVLTFNDNTGRDAFVFAIEAESATVDALDGKDGIDRA
jgi:hypothetical protein